jgi:hypothetical protein
MQRQSPRVDKRRATTARLLACLVSVFLFGLVSTAGAAQPHTPVLVTTDPASTQTSPAQSLTPTMIGEAEPEDHVVIESYPFAVDSFGGPAPETVERGTKHPEYEIKIFKGAGCAAGTEVTSGTAGTLEEAGIPLSVTADSSTTFSALQVDPGSPSEPSGCSNPLTYWEGAIAEEPSSGGGGGGGTTPNPEGSTPVVTTPGGGAVGPATPAGPKPEAPHIHTIPGAFANDVNPFIVGSAPKGTTVAIYASANCNGTPVAKGTVAELSSGLQVTVAPNAESVFSAVSIGAQHSGCSEPVTYIEDSTAPRTRVTMGPGVKTRKRAAVFRFKDVSADPPGTSFVCKVDKQKWKQCSSPFKAKHLKLGSHQVKIRATDLAGNVEPKPVTRHFRVVPRS